MPKPSAPPLPTAAIAAGGSSAPAGAASPDALLLEAEAQRALAELFPHLKLDALRAIQDLFPRRAAATLDERVLAAVH